MITDRISGRNAVLEASRSVEINYNNSHAILKRNTFFVSIIVLVAIVSKPTVADEYNINLGVISGKIATIHVLVGLFLIGIYQVSLYWIKFQQTIINNMNFSRIESRYFFVLAKNHAVNAWHTLTKALVDPKVNMAIQRDNFNPINHKQRDDGYWVVCGSIQTVHMNKQPKLLEALNNDKNFEISQDDRGFTQMNYLYTPTETEYKYLFMYRHFFWINWGKNFLEYGFPFYFGCFALLGLFIKIVSMFDWLKLLAP